MSCRPELVTASVDGELDATFRADLEAHLASCAQCAAQARAERALRQSLRGLPSPPMPAGLEDRVRASVRRQPRVPWRAILPLAAVLLLSFAWARGNALIVSWQLALDHRHCFGKERLPANVWGEDPRQVAAWFEAQGVTLPGIPEEANGLTLIGGRFCAMVDRKVAHLYYGNGERHASLYLVPGPVRFDTGEQSRFGARTVHLLRTGRGSVGVVAEDRADGEAFRKAFETTSARLAPQLPHGRARPLLTVPAAPGILVVLHPVGL